MLVNVHSHINGYFSNDTNLQTFYSVVYFLCQPGRGILMTNGLQHA